MENDNPYIICAFYVLLETQDAVFDIHMYSRKYFREKVCLFSLLNWVKKIEDFVKNGVQLYYIKFMEFSSSPLLLKFLFQNTTNKAFLADLTWDLARCGAGNKFSFWTFCFTYLHVRISARLVLSLLQLFPRKVFFVYNFFFVFAVKSCLNLGCWERKTFTNKVAK